jgi:5-methyltetrahydrofolate--homocysteine methyltransferase
MSKWRDRLNSRKLLVVDGAWGTQLTHRGLPVGQAPEVWNLQRTDDVRAIAAAYADAGADIVLTNTFGGNRFKLEKSGLTGKLEDVNRAGVELSKEGAGDRALVFASIGPTGEFIAPLGTVTEEQMVAAFAEQAKALVAAGADGIVIETMAALNEIEAAMRAVKDISDLPVVASMTFDKGAAGYATIMGVTPEQAAVELTAAGADIVGANCGSGIQDMVDSIAAMHAATDRPLWAKPNAGLPELVEGRTVFREAPEDMVSRLANLVEAGAHHVGGCCGTTPEHIALFKMCADNLRSTQDAYMKAMSALHVMCTQ